jgi:hypothetical protein
MKLIDRQAVEGTMPVIYIGHRVYRKSNGHRYVSRTWYAEYCMNARHYHQALKTSNKQIAIRKAHDIRRRIEHGQIAPRVYKLNSTQLKEQYLQVKRNENRAPKTIEKYTCGLLQFDQWCIATGRSSIVTFNESDFWSYNTWLTETGRSEKTRFDRVMLVKQAFKFAARMRLIPENLLSGISVVKLWSSRRKWVLNSQTVRRGSPRLRKFTRGCKTAIRKRCHNCWATSSLHSKCRAVTVG